jgi:hypothetical protein
MVTMLDQIFVLLKHWLVSFLPLELQTPVSVLISVVAIIGTFPALFALTTVLERKGLGRIQNRIGPNRTGPFGILQPIADGIKSLTKEDIVPLSADAVVHFMAPLVLVVAVFMGFAVLPMGRNMQLVDMDAGLLFFFAIGGMVEPQQIFTAGRDARGGADDQLRGAAVDVERGGGDDYRLAVAGEDCGGAEPIYVGIAALVYFYAVGLRGLCDVCGGGYGGDEQVAVRFA